MNSQFKKGALELCVLSQLALRDQYGYELTENISKEMKLAAGTLSAGTLYLNLKRLRDEEYVETYLVEAGEGPARKYYHLTVKGWAYQEQLKKEWFDFTAAVDRLIVSKESK